ncbi:fimbrial protein, partial [Escherichia coli]|uniref:fimbrial protein n=1 Tax=Escherichia coli TaxID=562 RepID=UPI002C1BE1D1
ADRNRSHWSTSKTPSYTKSVSWQHHPVPIPLTVYCAKSQNLGYYLSGTTADAGNSIFTNTASFSPAQGVGVQLTRNGTIIPANNTVSLGAVGTSAVSLGLTANYARTGGQVTAGNVKSIIGVTFVYQ